MHEEVQQSYVVIIHYQQKETIYTAQGMWTNIFFAQVNFLRARYPNYQTILTHIPSNVLLSYCLHLYPSFLRKKTL